MDRMVPNQPMNPNNPNNPHDLNNPNNSKNIICLVESRFKIMKEVFQDQKCQPTVDAWLEDKDNNIKSGIREGNVYRIVGLYITAFFIFLHVMRDTDVNMFSPRFHGGTLCFHSALRKEVTDLHIIVHLLIVVHRLCAF